MLADKPADFLIEDRDGSWASRAGFSPCPEFGSVIGEFAERQSCRFGGGHGLLGSCHDGPASAERPVKRRGQVGRHRLTAVKDLRQEGVVGVARTAGQRTQREAAFFHQPPNEGGEVSHVPVPIRGGSMGSIVSATDGICVVVTR